MDFWLECSDLAISSLPAPTVENSLRKSFHAVLELIRHSVYWVQKRQASARPRDWCFCLYCCVFEQQNALTRQSEATLRQRVSEPLVTYNDLLVNTAGESIRFRLILHVVAVRGRFHQRWMNLNNLAEQKLRKNTHHSPGMWDVISGIEQMYTRSVGLFFSGHFLIRHSGEEEAWVIKWAMAEFHLTASVSRSLVSAHTHTHWHGLLWHMKRPQLL